MPIAVLIPVYQAEEPALFDQALESIESQQVEANEIRIYLGIDGLLGSALGQVVAEHEPRLYKIVRHDNNIGPSRVLNSLYQVLEQEALIFRMDSDDVSLPGRFQKQIDFMAQHPEIDILGGAIEEHDVEKGQVNLRFYPQDPNGMTKAICKGNPVAHPTVCMRREVLDKLGGFPEVRNQDLALWIEALASGMKISNLGEPLVRMTISENFFKRRRSLKRSWPEIVLFTRAVWRLHGFSWRYIYPFSRLVFRLMSPEFHRRIYASRFRNSLLGDRKDLSL